MRLSKTGLSWPGAHACLGLYQDIDQLKTEVDGSLFRLWVKPASSKDERFTILLATLIALIDLCCPFFVSTNVSKPFPSCLPSSLAASGRRLLSLASHQPLVTWWGPLMSPDGPAAATLQAAG